MSTSLVRLHRSAFTRNIALPLTYSTRDGIPNLARQFSSALNVSGREERQLLSIPQTRVPERTFFKFKNEVKKRIEWVKPQKTPSIHPTKSGDLAGLPEINLKDPPREFLNSEEFKTSNDLVKRVFSLEFQSRDKKKEAMVEAMKDRVRRYKLDDKSIEVRVARWTSIIRNMQRHCFQFQLDKKAKADLKELIEFRKKQMKVLRREDYKRFEWLLEKLDLLYRPPPPFFKRIERKDSMRKLTASYVENIKQERLGEFRDELEAKKPEFLERKLATMKSIVEDEKEFGVQPSFTDEEIADVQRKVDEHRQAAAQREASLKVDDLF